MRKKGLNTHNVINEEKEQEIIKKHGFEEARKVTYVKLPATQKIMLFNSEHEVPMTIISEKEYNAEVRKQKKEQITEVHNAPGSATMVMVDMANDTYEDRSYETI